MPRTQKYLEFNRIGFHAKRTKLGLTLEQLAARINEISGFVIRPSTISRWENGNVGAPQKRFISAIQQVMHMRPSDLWIEQ